MVYVVRKDRLRLWLSSCDNLTIITFCSYMHLICCRMPIESKFPSLNGCPGFGPEWSCKDRGCLSEHFLNHELQRPMISLMRCEQEEKLISADLFFESFVKTAQRFGCLAIGLIRSTKSSVITTLAGGNSDKSNPSTT